MADALTTGDSSWTTMNESQTSAPVVDRFRARNPALIRAEVTVQAVVFVVTVVGNVLVMVALWRHARERQIRRRLAVQAGGVPSSDGRRLHHHHHHHHQQLQPHHGRLHLSLSRMDFMILHLTLADLSVAGFTVLPQLIWDALGQFPGNDVLCRCVAYLQVLAMYSSSYVLTATAIDRYLVICHPLRAFAWSRRRLARTLVGGAWAGAGLLSVPQLGIWGYREVDAGAGRYECWSVFAPAWTEKLYMTWSAVAIYFIPLVVISAAYIRICTAVWVSSRMHATGAEVVSTERASCRKPDELRLLKMHSASSSSATASTGSGKSRPSSTGSCRTACTTVDGVSDTSSRVPRRVFSTRGRVKAGDTSTTGERAAGPVSRAKLKTVKLTAAVVLSYFICWSPFFFSHLWSVWDNQAPYQGSVMTITALLSSLNSCSNPFIYFAFISSMWTASCRTLCCQSTRS